MGVSNPIVGGFMKPFYLIHLGLILIIGLVSTFLPAVPQAKVGGPINPGDTASDIGRYINKNVKPGFYKDNLLELQVRLADYQRDIESDEPVMFYKDLQNLGGNSFIEEFNQKQVTYYISHAIFFCAAQHNCC